jgi:hypothetical protein
MAKFPNPTFGEVGKNILVAPEIMILYTYDAEEYPNPKPMTAKTHLPRNLQDQSPLGKLREH